MSGNTKTCNHFWMQGPISKKKLLYLRQHVRKNSLSVPVDYNNRTAIHTTVCSRILDDPIDQTMHAWDYCTAHPLVKQASSLIVQ